MNKVIAFLLLVVVVVGLMMLAQRQGLRVHTIIASAGEQGVDDPVGDAGHRRLADVRQAWLSVTTTPLEQLEPVSDWPSNQFGTGSA